MAAIVRDGAARPARSASRPVARAGHRDVHGKPCPGTFAAGRRAGRAARRRWTRSARGVFQVVPAGVGGVIAGDADDAMETELDWLMRLGERTRAADHVPGDGAERRRRPLAAVVRRGARAPTRGARNIRPQVGDRCFGVLMGHQSRLNPFQYRADLPEPRRPAARRARRAPARPEVRARILGRGARPLAARSLMDQIGRRAFDRPVPARRRRSTTSRPRPRASAPSPTRAGVDPWEVAYDAAARRTTATSSCSCPSSTTAAAPTTGCSR